MPAIESGAKGIDVSGYIPYSLRFTRLPGFPPPATAAFRAASERFLGVSFVRRAFPLALPPLLANLSEVFRDRVFLRHFVNSNAKADSEKNQLFLLTWLKRIQDNHAKADSG